MEPMSPDSCLPWPLFLSSLLRRDTTGFLKIPRACFVPSRKKPDYARPPQIIPLMSKAKRSNIEVQGTAIGILSQPGGDYISLTDMVRNFDGAGALIEQWLKNKDTVLFLGVWERINNPDFNSLEFEGVKNEAGRNSFFLSAKKWIDLTKAQASAVYASEADLLNVALFGQTAKQWRDANPRAEGNLRDHAPLEQLVVLTNLESLNSVLIRQGLPQPERLNTLNDIAITQMRTLLSASNVKRLK